MFLVTKILFEGSSPSPESDVFSLGAVLYSLIIGEPPRRVSTGIAQDEIKKATLPANANSLFERPSCRY